MLDIKWIRENQEAFPKGLTDRAFPEPGEVLYRGFHAEHEGKNGGGDPWHTDGRLAIVTLR